MLGMVLKQSDSLAVLMVLIISCNVSPNSFCALFKADAVKAFAPKTLTLDCTVVNA